MVSAHWTFAMAGLAAAFSLAGVHASARELSRFIGVASVYSANYSGKTASGDPYDPEQFTAAHPTLPFGTLLHITDSCNDRSVTVVVNDRGPFVEGRVLDLSQAAARALGVSGLMTVTATVQTGRAIKLRALFSDHPPAR